jgi:hypothetical protein
MGTKEKKGLADWEAMFPRLFELHGKPITMSAALAHAPDVVRELVALIEEHPLELYRYQDAVVMKETDAAAKAPEAVNRAMDILEAHQDLAKEWLWQMIW